MRIFLFIFCIVLILVLFFTLIVYFFINKEKKIIIKKLTKTNDTDLDKMIDSISNVNFNDAKLKELVQIYLQTYNLGVKTSNNLDDVTKKKLEFVSALSANPNSSAQTISFLNRELNKISGTYKKEIDTYEYMGLARRMK